MFRDLTNILVSKMLDSFKIKSIEKQKLKLFENKVKNRHWRESIGKLDKISSCAFLFNLGTTGTNGSRTQDPMACTPLPCQAQR